MNLVYATNENDQPIKQGKFITKQTNLYVENGNKTQKIIKWTRLEKNHAVTLFVFEINV